MILNQIIQIVHSGQMPTALSMVQEFITTYIDTIRDVSNILLTTNLATHLLNGG
jgi:hypothetical protein